MSEATVGIGDYYLPRFKCFLTPSKCYQNCTNALEYD